MTKSSLIYPQHPIRLITFHILNFKSKEKACVCSVSDKWKKEAIQPALVSTGLIFFVFCCLRAGCGHKLGRRHLRMKGCVWRPPSPDPVYMESGRGGWRSSSICVPAIHHNIVHIKCQTQSPALLPAQLPEAIGTGPTCPGAHPPSQLVQQKQALILTAFFLSRDPFRKPGNLILPSSPFLT